MEREMERERGRGEWSREAFQGVIMFATNFITVVVIYTYLTNSYG